MLITGLSIAWLLGVYAGSLLSFPLPLTFLLPVPILLFAAAGLGFLTGRGRGRPLLPLLALAVAVLGMARFQNHAQGLGLDDLAGWRDAGVVSLRGVVESEPDVGDVTARWVLQVAAVRSPAGQDWEPRGGLVQVYSRWTPEVRYGDELLLEGKLQTPPELERFDYQEYLLRQGVHSIMRYPRIQILAAGKGNKALEVVYSLRKQLAASLQRALPEPQSSLAQGILLGMRGGIPEVVQEEFRRTGTTHILAISGHNLSVATLLLAGSGIWLFGRRHWAYLAGMLLAVWGYATLVGLAPSVMRAAIMTSFVLVGGYAGRQVFAPLALFFAAALMTAFDPYVLWDIGFQLSFLAMAGIIFCVPPVEDAAGRLLQPWLPLPGPLEYAGRFVGSGLAATLGATVATLPVLALNFYYVPLAAFPATLFALPALPGILIGAFATAVLGLTGFLAPVLTLVPAGVTWLMCSYMMQVVHWWAQVPGASLQLPELDSSWGWAYLSFLAIILLAWARWLRRTDTPPTTKWTRLAQGLVLLLLAANVAVWALVVAPPEEELRVRFLDVEQGDAILLETRSGQRVLVDGGPSPSLLLNELGKALPFWDPRVDLLVLTHPQRDHLTGLLAVLRRYQVGAVIESGLPHQSEDYIEWRRLLAEKGIPSVELTAGGRLRLKGADVEVLYPRIRALETSGNNPNLASLVLQVTANGHSVLLTGDIEADAERALLRYRPKLASDVLKVAHHGSKTSSIQSFLNAVAPQVAVISVGADNTFGHPSPEVLARFRCTPVLRTDLHGTVTLSIGPSSARLWADRLASYDELGCSGAR